MIPPNEWQIKMIGFSDIPSSWLIISEVAVSTPVWRVKPDSDFDDSIV